MSQKKIDPTRFSKCLALRNLQGVVESTQLTNRVSYCLPL